MVRLATKTQQHIIEECPHFKYLIQNRTINKTMEQIATQREAQQMKVFRECKRPHQYVYK